MVVSRQSCGEGCNSTIQNTIVVKIQARMIMQWMTEEIYRAILVAIGLGLLIATFKIIRGVLKHFGEPSVKISDPESGKRSGLMWASFAALMMFAFVLFLEKYRIVDGKIIEKTKQLSTPSAPSLSNQTPSTVFSQPNVGYSKSVAQSGITCMFIWVVERGEFVKIDHHVTDRNAYTNSFIPRVSRSEYVADLIRQLREADAADNAGLAREIVKEIERNTITVYYEKYLSDELIRALVSSRGIGAQC